MFNKIPKRPVGSLYIPKSTYDNGGTIPPFQTLLVDSSAGAFTLNLPPMPSLGDWVTVIDSTNSFGSKPLTLNRGNSLIVGVAENLVCDNAGMVLDIFYSGPTRGWMFNGNNTKTLPIRTGSAVLVGGTVTVANTSITATTRVYLTVDGYGVLANLGSIYEDKASRVAGASFIIKSTNVLDTSTIVWLLIEP